MPESILIIHNRYQQAGGEDVVVDNEVSLLRSHGHQVHFRQVSNDLIQGFWRKFAAAWQADHSKWGLRQMTKFIQEADPDVIHVHNFFPLLSPSIYDACRSAGVPVVQTLHNFRTICPSALLMREGRVCEDCIQGTPYQAVLHKCYRGSRLGSLAVAKMVANHRRKNTWATKVDRFIALTEFSKNKFIEAGFPENKITVKPNFISEPKGEKGKYDNRQGALFVGRLSPEKGIHTLLKAWNNLEVPLKIIGDGPLMEGAKGQAADSVMLLGRKNGKQVAEEMSQAGFLVMPSEWYETFGLTIIEAFALGLPVIASRLGAMAEIVEDGVTGLLFTPGDAEDLSRKVLWAYENPEDMRRMGRNARLIYQEKYTPEINYHQLLAVYEDAIGQNLRHKTTLQSQ